ncbi:hypothetical protein FVEN_g13148 [Fusarium venenatum]|nr:hypothetical protein FVEN_g13148 [Fusarium venenatum]
MLTLTLAGLNFCPVTPSVPDFGKRAGTPCKDCTYALRGWNLGGGPRSKGGKPKG